MLLLSLSLRTLAAPPKPEGNTGFAVIELFTSEGCFSCPPAEALAAKIMKERTDNVYLLSMHVDYWDKLGWRDPYSNVMFTERQREYAAFLKTGEIYTPQMVVNGQTSFVGSDEKTLESAIDAGLALMPNVHIEDLQALNSGGKLNVRYKLNGLFKGKILVALVQLHARTAVKRGENIGKTLNHLDVVRDLQQADVSKVASGTLTMPLPREYGKCAVVAFVQDPADGSIVSAASAAIQ